MFKSLVFILFIAGSGLGATGDKPVDHNLKLAQARQAKTRYEAAMKKAYDAWRLGAIAADKQYIQELDEAKRVAMRNTDLAEANKVQAVRDEIDEHLKNISKGPGGRNNTIVRIYADKEWQPVLKVRKNQRFKIAATGKWNINIKQANGLCGPEGREDGFGKLLGKLNDEEQFIIGAGREWIADADGTLAMMCDDPLKFDNTGFVTVEVINPDANEEVPAPTQPPQ